ncbi:uncharacterized protein F4812DRAFT_46675 [Daldinia caldariorum]|uniref:uncharacterized protein n=1 Tax=Daldinia caldariorum TaxID=326644 RepID=UPI002007A2E8|nr:uncharacterized protein F4812DRAFT_46675 [Daldinia caldariorum]KAI1467043.1 hypothetical protein F4812DRAFT_46675 [Daldinia caldariorum]
MAYRVVSQPDLDPAHGNAFASVADLFDYNILNRPVSFGRSSTPTHLTPFSPNQQDHSSNRLPSLPDLLLNDYQFSTASGSFQQVHSSVPHYSPRRYPTQERNRSPPANYNNHSEGRPSWAPSRLGVTLFGLDSSLRRLSHFQTDAHLGLAPPRGQEQRPLSSNTRNIIDQLPQSSRPGFEANSDDYYLTALGDGDFSSPSLPPINSSPLLPTRPRSSNLPKPLEVGEAMPATSSRRSRNNKEHLVDLTKEEPDFDSTSGVDPATPSMPSVRKRAAVGANNDAASKRLRTSHSSPSNSGRASRTKWKPNDQNPFADDGFCGPADEIHEAIDLSNAAEVPSELMAPKTDNRVKLGKFQCVICMDDTSYLTVTHCGHLFCSECLHSALHIDNMKKTCPVCRTKVDPKEKKGKNQKSYYHLELKIMTANKKGKRPAVSS